MLAETRSRRASSSVGWNKGFGLGKGVGVWGDARGVKEGGREGGRWRFFPPREREKACL